MYHTLQNHGLQAGYRPQMALFAHMILKKEKKKGELDAKI